MKLRYYRRGEFRTKIQSVAKLKTFRKIEEKQTRDFGLRAEQAKVENSE